MPGARKRRTPSCEGVRGEGCARPPQRPTTSPFGARERAGHSFVEERGDQTRGPQGSLSVDRRVTPRRPERCLKPMPRTSECQASIGLVASRTLLRNTYIYSGLQGHLTHLSVYAWEGPEVTFRP